MNKYNIKIDNIYWERIQLYIEGHTHGLDINDGEFFLKDVYTNKIFKPNEFKVFEKRAFILRFNIAISNDGSYLPSGQFKIIFKQDIEYTANLSGKLFDPLSYDMNDENREKYELIKNENDKINFLLRNLTHVFTKKSQTKDIVYKVVPIISGKSNKLLLKVEFSYPNQILKMINEKLRSLKKPYKNISYEMRKVIFNSIFIISKTINKKNSDTVLFTSDSRGHRSGNIKYIYEEMMKQGLNKKYKFHEIYKSNVSLRRSKGDKFLFPYLLGKADYIFLDDYHPLLYHLNFRKNQEIIQLWHAVGSFKTVGYSRTGMKDGPFFNSVNHRNYTKVYVSSDKDVPNYAEAFGILESKIYPLGIPRTDMFFDDHYKKIAVQKVQENYPILKNKNIILYAPTFRGSGHYTAFYPYEMLDFEKLARYCSETNSIILLKMHPFVKREIEIPENYNEYFIDISKYREINDFLLVADILISDYSSLIYEFAILKKPMLFYAFDLEEYSSNRGFYEPYNEFVPGKIVNTFEELIDSLYRNDFDQEKVDRFLEKRFTYLDGNSSERIVKHIFKT
ncbi:CDP-glycerol glycerophosphotransferase family protein [Mammaliicoccus sciuri]|uniref:CDP-glycerol glycerophosphotransferase family protein n=1 Tax=Mammaliicoccus sciuri TaxID=1296 RepID=UPI003F544C00